MQTLPRWRQLRFLQLDRTDMHRHDAIIASLAASLPRCSKLSHLQLSQCQLRDEHLVALCLGLRQASSLRTLYLAGNCLLRERGAHALMEAVLFNRSLRQIDLRGCDRRALRPLHALQLRLLQLRVLQ